MPPPVPSPPMQPMGSVTSRADNRSSAIMNSPTMYSSGGMQNADEQMIAARLQSAHLTAPTVDPGCGPGPVARAATYPYSPPNIFPNPAQFPPTNPGVGADPRYSAPMYQEPPRQNSLPQSPPPPTNHQDIASFDPIRAQQGYPLPPGPNRPVSSPYPQQPQGAGGGGRRRPRKILFYHRNEDHYGFTNFSPHEVVFNNKAYPTSEHLFQAQKVGIRFLLFWISEYSADRIDVSSS